MQRTSLDHIKQVIRLSLPMAGSRFLQMLSGFIGMIMAARLGRTVLAACALINSTVAATLLIFIAIIFAVSFVSGQTAGANNDSKMGALVQQALMLSLMLGLLMTLVFWFAPDLLTLFNQDPKLIIYVKQYFHALVWGAIPLLLQACLQQFMYGILKQRIVIIINFILLMISIPASYILIFGSGIIPAFGVAGLGFSFALQAWLGLFVIIGVCYFNQSFHAYALFSKHSHAGLIYLRKIWQVGWPMSLQFGGELLAFFVVAMMIGWLGTNALAAVQVTQQWLLLVIVPVFAMSESAGILVGRAVGANQYDQLKAIGQASFYVVFSLVFLLGLMFLFAPNQLAALYINVNDPMNQHLMHLIRILFSILIVTLFLNAFRDITSGLLRGLYDTRFAMHVGLFVMWGMVLPIGYLMAFVFGWGVIGFKAGGCVGLLLGAVIILNRWRQKVDDYSSKLSVT